MSHVKKKSEATVTEFRSSRRETGHVVFALLALLLHGDFAGILASAANDPGWDVRQWTTEQGLPQNTVMSLAQSKDGYMWIGTRAGLARFDGVRFTTFINELLVAEPGDTSVLQICADEQEGVWIRTSAVLLLYRRGEFIRFPLGRGAVPGEIFHFQPAKGTGLWLATRNGLLLFRDGTIVQRFDRRNGLPSAGIDSIQWDADKHLWIKKDSRLWRMDGDRFVPIATVFGSNITARGIWFESRERAWFGNRGRLDVWESGRWSAYTSEYGLPTNLWVSEVQIDRQGRRWIKPEHGLWLWNGERFASVSGTDVLPETDIRCFMEDREGGMWVGTGRGGVYRLQAKPIRVLSQEDGLASRDAHTVTEGHDRRLWIGGASGLSLLERGEVRRFRNTNAVLGNNFTAALADQQGRVWVSVLDRGLLEWNGNGFTPVSLPVTNNARLRVTALHEDRTGRLWIGSSEGLFCRTNEGVRTFKASEGLTDVFVRGIAEGRDGTLWIGTARGGLHVFRGDRLLHCPGQENLPSPNVRPLHVEANGTLWFSTPGGLHRLKDEQIRSITTRHGLFDNHPLALLDDGLGNFWMSCNRGIYRVPVVDLHAVADGLTNSAPCSVYGTSDGLTSTECDGDTQPCASKLSDGRLCFATTRGLAVFSPAELLKHDLRPPVTIEQVKVDEREVNVATPKSGIRHFRIAAGAARLLEIHFTANSLSVPEKVRFKYRLEPRDSRWREVGAERFAFFPNLQPGDYTFRVNAANHHGLWNETSASLSFSVAPHLHETWWFYALCGMTVIGGAGAVQAYRLRVQRRILKLEQTQVLNEERGRIARDLHDELGARLTALAMRAELAGRSFTGAVAEDGRAVVEESRALAERMRDVIWAVDPECDSLEAFVARLTEQAEDFARSAGIRLRLELPDTLPALPLSADARHQLTMVAREALHNVLKHARASEVRLGLELRDGELRLRVSDNGAGLDKSPRLGRGMANMKKRIHSLGGVFQIRSQSGEGAVAEARVPLKNLEQNPSSR